jgi:polysaccharide export outer membrane protein
MCRRAHLLGLIVVLCIPASTVGQSATTAKGATAAQKPATPPSTASNQPKPATEDAGYIIGAEDVLNINVWKEPDLSRAVPVRPDGKISMPLLNDVQAAGLTPQQLAASIRDGLKKFIADPEVTVIVTAVNSRRVYIMGEVTHPGAFLMSPGMTVLQALASAGSFTQFANIKGIYVLRTEDGKQVKHPFNYKAVVKGQHPEQNLELKPGDTIVVP